MGGECVFVGVAHGPVRYDRCKVFFLSSLSLSLILSLSLSSSPPPSLSLSPPPSLPPFSVCVCVGGGGAGGCGAPCHFQTPFPKQCLFGVKNFSCSQVR
jgi:hypothetical protein